MKMMCFDSRCTLCSHEISDLTSYIEQLAFYEGLTAVDITANFEEFTTSEVENHLRHHVPHEVRLNWRRLKQTQLREEQELFAYLKKNEML